jgi:hypothetical protein
MNTRTFHHNQNFCNLTELTGTFVQLRNFGGPILLDRQHDLEEKIENQIKWATNPNKLGQHLSQHTTNLLQTVALKKVKKSSQISELDKEHR